MSNPADLLTDTSDSDPFGRQPVEGIVAVAPGAVSDLLRVFIPSFADDQVWELRWTPPPGGLPTAGDRCLVVFTKDGTAWAPSVWTH